MALIDTYERNKPLQDQVDFPIQAEGLELIVEKNGRGGPKFLVKKMGKLPKYLKAMPYTLQF